MVEFFTIDGADPATNERAGGRTFAYLSTGILGLGAVFGHQGRDFGDVGDEIQKISHLKQPASMCCVVLLRGTFTFSYQ